MVTGVFYSSVFAHHHALPNLERINAAGLASLVACDQHELTELSRSSNEMSDGQARRCLRSRVMMKGRGDRKMKSRVTTSAEPHTL